MGSLDLRQFKKSMKSAQDEISKGARCEICGSLVDNAPAGAMTASFEVRPGVVFFACWLHAPEFRRLLDDLGSKWVP